jgi:hypothetical protein
MDEYNLPRKPQYKKLRAVPLKKLRENSQDNQRYQNKSEMPK